jgi:hypothetical protein
MMAPEYRAEKSLERATESWKDARLSDVVRGICEHESLCRPGSPYTVYVV